MIYDAFSLIQVDVEAIKSVNQTGNNLLSEAHGLKQPQVAVHHHKVFHLLRIQLGPLGVTTLLATEKTRSDLVEAAGTGKTSFAKSRN